MRIKKYLLGKFGDNYTFCPMQLGNCTYRGRSGCQTVSTLGRKCINLFLIHPINSDIGYCAFLLTAIGIDALPLMM